MTATVTSDVLKVGLINLGGQEHEVFVSAKSAEREGVTPRPFFMLDDKQKFLNKDAKDTFNSDYYKTDKVLYIDNLSRVSEVQPQELKVKQIHDSYEVEVPEGTSAEEVVEALKGSGVPVSEELTKAVGQIVGPEYSPRMEEMNFEDPIGAKEIEEMSEKSAIAVENAVAQMKVAEDTPIHLVTSHSSTPFDLTKVYSQAISESTPTMPEEYILVREYDHVVRDFDGDVKAYLASGGKKTQRHKWETLHVTNGDVDNAVQIGEKKLLWYKFGAAAGEGHRLLPELPVYRIRNGKPVRVKSIK